MTYAEKRTHEGKAKRVLVPVVHNMLFVRKDEPQRQMLHLLASCNVPLHVMKKEGSTGLGLALVKAVADSYGMAVEYRYSDCRHHFLLPLGKISV